MTCTECGLPEKLCVCEQIKLERDIKKLVELPVGILYVPIDLSNTVRNERQKDLIEYLVKDGWTYKGKIPLGDTFGEFVTVAILRKE